MEQYEELYNQLIGEMKRYHPSSDFSMVEKAYLIARQAHGKQLRKSGEPYIIHPLCVAIILAELKLDIESIVAGILHDVVEDTTYSCEDITKMFNSEVALLVDGVTKLEKIEYSSKEEMQAENYRKMFLAMAKDIRVILIKIADRLHNMRTLKYMRPEKQKEKAQETLDIYAPLANRLGISKIKIELEDLSLRYLNPDAYHDLAYKISRKLSERQDYVSKIVEQLRKKCEEYGIKNFEVYGRPKHFFSIYKKMLNQNKTLDQIYDLFAVRVIVETTEDCYKVLGIAHTMYKIVPNRFKDYIGMPKANKYQSLHNTLIGPEGLPFEIQIRTFEMHKVAELGIAAHWKYKEGISGSLSNNEEAKLSWLRQILEWQQDMSDNKEFMETVKTDLDIFNDQVYCFTPKGEVKNLPNGATPIDFAYSIHSAVGNKMVGARVNGKIVTFDYKIQNGDRIEVITSQNSRGPSMDWLKNVKSSQAKNKINQWFKKINKEENIVKGKELLEKEAKRKGLVLSELLTPERMASVMDKYSFKDWDSICAAVGHGGIKDGQVINKLNEEYQKELKKQQKSKDILTKQDEYSQLYQEQNNLNKQAVGKTSGIVVNGIGNVSVRYSKCCSPVPGDEIVGFITRGRGVSIHRTDCVNIINLNEEERQRLMEAHWNVEENQGAFQAEIRVKGKERIGFLADITKTLSEEKIPVKNSNSRTVKDEAIIDLAIMIIDKEQLKNICSKLLKIKDVYDIERITT